MGFNPTFYAGRPKLSEVTIDSDLDMGGRGILRVGRVDSPYMPDTWPTEVLDWGDVPQSVVYELSVDTTIPGSVLKVGEFTSGSNTMLYELRADVTENNHAVPVTVALYIDDALIVSCAPPAAGRHTLTETVLLPANKSVEVRTISSAGSGRGTLHAGTCVICKGVVMQDTHFDLAGKWLALGIDMEGLTATVKIQGVEVPYSDYVKYFPLAPSELTISGNWDASQIRPIVKGYK